MTVERALPLLILSTIGLSGLLLGMGQGDFEPVLVAILGATAAFTLVDWLKWFQLPQWLANLLAIIVTIVTVSNFYFTNDSVRHLLGVGKLLVYLQTILLFQRKSSRVYWQVLVLSLLQIVVGAVFNLGFEGGVLFIVYMLVAGISMMLLYLYQDRQVNRVRNEEIKKFFADNNQSGSKRKAPAGQPLAIGINPDLEKGVLRRMVGSFNVFAAGALFFSILLFYFLPRDHSSWSGPKEVPMRQTGFDDRVDMGHNEVILLSNSLKMNVRYWRPGKQKSFAPISQPYLRGMALSNLQIDGNKTNWVPPPYQVYDSDFRQLRSVQQSQNYVVQEIVLEPTEDPLLYSAMPPQVDFAKELSGEFEWCWPLGCVSRQRSADKLPVSHFRYDLEIPILGDGDFYKAWPYSPRNGPVSLVKEEDEGTYSWLTYLDRERYPTIVREGKRIAEQFSSRNHFSIAKQMETWFQSGDFRYTIDFRNMDKNDELDTVEDFVANFKAGHCEYYASALALMLRSQGIPARLVVGFRGGDVNDFGGHLDVESRHAHAWVEAYIRPNDCPDELIRSNQASRVRGCWLRLDGTPSFDIDQLASSSDDALDFAKSLWRDYVLGLQSDSQSRVTSGSGFGLGSITKVLDLEWWQGNLKNAFENVKNADPQKRLFQSLAGLIVLLTLTWYWFFRKNSTRTATDGAGENKNERQLSLVRRGLGRALMIVSPRLGKWIAGPETESDEIPFNTRMLQMLANAGFEKGEGLTQREFAIALAKSEPPVDELDLSRNSKENERVDFATVSALTHSVTDFYYQVRFGNHALTEQQHVEIQESIAKLGNALGGI